MTHFKYKRPVFFQEVLRRGSSIKGRIDAENKPFVKYPGEPERQTTHKNNDFTDALLGGKEITEQEYAKND